MKLLKLFLIICTVLVNTFSIAHAENSSFEMVNLDFYSSKHFKLNNDIARIFIGSSKIATAVQLLPLKNEFVITSQNTEGSTTLLIWTVDGAKHEYMINVSKDYSAEAKIIEQAIGLPNVHVKKVDNRILLTGTVKNQYERNLAIQVARLYVGGGSKSSLTFGSNVSPSLSTQGSDDNSSNTMLTENDKVEDKGQVIDLLQMINPAQIRLEAQIIEINSNNAKDLGIQYGTSGSGGVFSVGESYNRATGRGNDFEHEDDGVNGTVSFNRRPLRWIEQRFGPINATINALVSKGKARILSRPSVTTMSGEQATIQIGGEIPYTVQSDNGPHTEWKNYGIILQFKPIIDAQDRISSTVNTEVSNLSGQTVDGEPIISTRRADSVITLNSGSTMIIGGLMDSSESKTISKIPLLGDIPILGEFFKYTSKSRDKREIIILVTPYILVEDDISHSQMSDTMKDYYHQNQREKNNLNDVNLNAPPPEKSARDNKNGKKHISDPVYVSEPFKDK